MKKPSFLIIVGGFLLLAVSIKKIPVDYQPALQNISVQAIQAHMRFLSSDLLFGREPGTEGYQIAAKYMASQFEKIGLDPAGDDSTYFQEVILSRYSIDYSGSAIAVTKQDETKLLAADEDYFIYTRHSFEIDSEGNKMVFGGFGLEYPKHQYHPFNGIDVEGKILLVVLGNPDFTTPVRSSGIFEKIEEAESRGAKGVILIASPQLLSNYSWSRLKIMNGRGFEIKAKNSLTDFFSAVVHHKVANELTGISMDSLFSMANTTEFKAFELATRLAYHINVERTENLTQSPNVIAKLTGSDPQLKNEYLVYTAHLDHLGVGWPINGDSIYNGAYDNASGCAILLEIANAFKSLPSPPSRSILFIALTAEEIGLFGSKYFVKYPTVPLENIVANLNIDMVLMEGPLNTAVALGKDFVDFEEMIDESTDEIGVKLVPDPMPQERLFMRSDHFTFVQKGIPAIFIINDLTDSLNHAWFRSHYHSPHDEFRETMHFDAGVKHAQLNFLIGYRISQNPQRPKWKENSPYAIK